METSNGGAPGNAGQPEGPSLLERLPGILREARRQADVVCAAATAADLSCWEVRGDGEASIRANAWAGGLLLQGDNLAALAALVAEPTLRGAVDMVYVDPPFESHADYEATVPVAGAAVTLPAYGDTWGAGTDSYVLMLATRLILMRELLAPTGVLCLHLDWHVGHYARVLLDEIFGRGNFVNEVIWRYGKMARSPRRFAQSHDTIFVYAKGPDYFFQPVDGEESEYKRRFRRYVVDNKVRYAAVKNSSDKLIRRRVAKVEKRLGRPLEDGDVLFDFATERKALTDVLDVPIIRGNARERVGYGTQKPEALLEKIITAFCPRGGLVADFFAGSGTTAAVAARTGRRWIMADASPVALLTIRRRAHRLGLDYAAARVGGGGDRDTGAERGAGGGVTAEARRRNGQLQVWISRCEVPLPQGLSQGDREQIQREVAADPLALVAGWAVDPAADGKVLRPVWETFEPTRQITLNKEAAGRAGGVVAVRVLDVFGGQHMVHCGDRGATTLLTHDHTKR